MYTTRKSIHFFGFLFILMLSNICLAQSNELKGWSSVEYGVELSDRFKIDLSQHFRLKEDLNVVDTYITESEISYKPIKKLILLGQLRYYSRNDNNGGIQGYENMIRYRLGVEKKFTSNKFNFDIEFLLPPSTAVLIKRSLPCCMSTNNMACFAVFFTNMLCFSKCFLTTSSKDS